METLRRFSYNIILGLILIAFAFSVSGGAQKPAKPDSGLKADTGKAIAETLLHPKRHPEVVVGIGPGEKSGSIKIKTGDKEINIDIAKNKNFKEGDVYVGVNDTIHDDIAARGNVTVAGVVTGDAAAIGGAVNISGKVEGDVAAIGGPVTLVQGGEVGGDLAAIGGPATIGGKVGGDVAAVGGPIDLDSTAAVGGDVATVGGPVTKTPGAKIGGSVTNMDLGLLNQFIPKAVGVVRFGGDHPFLRRSIRLGLSLIWFLGLWVLLLLVVLFLPKHTEVIEETITSKFFLSGLVGIVAEILILPVFLLLIVTIIGIPLALILEPVMILVAYLMGFAAIAVVLGRRLSQGLNWKGSSVLGLVSLGYLLLVICFILGRLLIIPGGVFTVFGVMLLILGWMIIYCALTVGFGACLYTRFGTKPGPWRKA